jgi:hypothetical protein
MSARRRPHKPTTRLTEAGVEALYNHLVKGTPIAHPGQGRIACPECGSTSKHSEYCHLRKGLVV